MRACSLHHVEMVLRARVLACRGGWRIWTYYACPARVICGTCNGCGYELHGPHKGIIFCHDCTGRGSWPCSQKRTQKRGGDAVFRNKAFAEQEAARINRGKLKL